LARQCTKVSGRSDIAWGERTAGERREEVGTKFQIMRKINATIKHTVQSKAQGRKFVRKGEIL